MPPCHLCQGTILAIRGSVTASALQASGLPIAHVRARPYPLAGISRRPNSFKLLVRTENTGMALKRMVLKIGMGADPTKAAVRALRDAL